MYFVPYDYNISLILKSNRDNLLKRLILQMINSLHQLLFSIRLPYMVASIFLLVLLSGFFVVTFGGLDHINVQGSVNCDPQTSSPADCPAPSGEEETNDDDDRGNIEEEIPSVIPFP
jgi:hypothetical protein